MWWFANVLRTCPLSASALPAPTIRASWHAQPVRQPRRNKQRARHGPEREPRVHRERRSGRRRNNDTEGNSDEPQAEPSKTGEPADRRKWWPSPKQTPSSSRRVSTKSCSRPSSRRIRRCETRRRRCGHSLDQSIEPRSGHDAKTDADLRRKRCGRRREDTPEGHHSCGHTWALQQRSIKHNGNVCQCDHLLVLSRLSQLCSSPVWNAFLDEVIDRVPALSQQGS